MQIRNGGGADSEQRAAAFGILAPLAVRRARLAFAACRTAHVVRFFLASQLPLAHCHVKPPVFAAAQIFLLRLRPRRVRRRGSEQR